MLLAAVILTFGVVGLWCWWYKCRYERLTKYIEKFPGPPTWFLVGNIFQLGFQPDDVCSTFLRWCLEYDGPAIRIYAGPQPFVVLLSPKLVEVVLSSTELAYKEDLYSFFRPWLGQGLLTSNDRHWAKHRKMITPSFHFKILQDYLCVINETTDRFLKLLQTFAEKQEMFNIQTTITHCTIDVICEAAMGVRINTIEGVASPLAQAINELCHVISERAFSAFKRSDFLFRLSPLYRTQENSLKVIRRILNGIIEERRLLLKQCERRKESDVDDSNGRRKVPFLENLLTAEIDGRPLSFQEIFEEVSTFMFEGHDTTAMAENFAIFCLSRHKHVQQKAFHEQRDIFGDDKCRNPTYQELQDMKYLELVIKETLRLFPSVPVIARSIRKNTILDGKVVPAGTTLVIPIIGLGRRADIFPEPNEFRPERFDRERRSNDHVYDYVPFSAGPRNCIGQKFAMMEIKVTLSKILRNFEILPAVDGLPSALHDATVKPTSPYEPRLCVSVTLKSANGVYIRLRQREY